MKIQCPECRKDTVYSKENIYRPFCSKRCQLLDLGEWAEEKFRLASDQPLSEEDVDKIEEEFRKRDS